MNSISRHRPPRPYPFIAAALIALTACLAPAAIAQPAAGKAPTPEQTRADVTALLQDFLKPGNNDKAEWHERFWAEDLVYTTSGGIVKTKAEIRQSFKDAAKPAAEPGTRADREEATRRDRREGIEPAEGRDGDGHGGWWACVDDSCIRAPSVGKACVRAATVGHSGIGAATISSV